MASVCGEEVEERWMDGETEEQERPDDLIFSLRRSKPSAVTHGCVSYGDLEARLFNLCCVSEV